MSDARLSAVAGPPEILLAAEAISHDYGAGPVLESVDLAVRAGEFAALVGPNGSGKSTLLRILLGLLRPTQGRGRLLGGDPRELTDRWRIGYVPQRASIAPDLPATVEELVLTGRLAKRGWWRRPSAQDRQAAAHFIEAVGLSAHAHRRVRELSGGQQQRALIARALVNDPVLLVLDEPIAGIDAEAQALFRDALRHAIDDHDAAVLLVSHELGAVADTLDRVVVLKRRVVFDGTPSELAARGVSLGVHAADLPLWLEGLR